MPPRLRIPIIPPAKGIQTAYYIFGEPTVEPTGQIPVSVILIIDKQLNRRIRRT